MGVKNRVMTQWLASAKLGRMQTKIDKLRAENAALKASNLKIGEENAAQRMTINLVTADRDKAVGEALKYKQNPLLLVQLRTTNEVRATEDALEEARAGVERLNGEVAGLKRDNVELASEWGKSLRTLDSIKDML